jgi:hypothetical protein
MQPPANNRDEWDVQQTGAVLEAVGILPQTEYVRLKNLQSEVFASQGRISDTDFDWLLTLLNESSEPATRSMVMVFLAALAELGPLPKPRRDRIGAAVAPYLQSNNDLDRLSSAHVQKWLAATEA